MTKTDAKDLLNKLKSEFDVMARDPLFALHGGDSSPASRQAYVRRRLDELLVWNRGCEAALEVVRAARAEVQL